MIGHILRQRYKIIEKIGKGGFGETYLAEYPQDLPVNPKYKCVIKRLTRQSTPDLNIEDRFKKEAAILFKLGQDHAQIPKLYDFIDENRKFYLVQEFVDGHDLSYEITKGQLWKESEVIELLKEVLDVLAFVHKQGVIHRDIKPLNLMRRYSDNKLVLIDFGIVKEISNLGSTIPIGTTGYMPSEQLDSHPQLSSDIYALGITAIEALTGLSGSDLQRDPNNLEVSWRDRVQVSDWLADILTKMVRRDFKQRYADATEALQAFGQTVVDLPTSATSYLPTSTTSLKLIKIGEKYGYIDYEGRIAIPPIFDKAGDFCDEIALAVINKNCGFIKKNGDFVVVPLLNFNYGDLIFREGLASVEVDGKYGFIDKSVNFVISPIFDASWGFNEGVAAVKVDGKYGFIDKLGNFVISPRFDNAWEFREGLAAVEFNERYGFIDKSGNFVISPLFRKDYYNSIATSAFSEGLAAVEFGIRYGYINRDGKFIISCIYEETHCFCEGMA